MVSPENDVVWRMRWILAASCTVIAVAVAVVVSTQASHWVWALFLWGFMVCAAGAIIIEIAARLLATRVEDNPATGLAWRRRRPVYDGLWLFFGGVLGTIAAAFDLVIVDVIATAYIAITLGLGCALIMKRMHQVTAP